MKAGRILFTGGAAGGGGGEGGIQLASHRPEVAQPCATSLPTIFGGEHMLWMTSPVAVACNAISLVRDQAVAEGERLRGQRPKKVCVQKEASNHLEERLLDQAQARASYTPLFWGHSRSIPQGMILDVQPLVKSLFCPMRPSPNGFFDSEAPIP